MIAEYKVESENVRLTLLPLDGGPVVTQLDGPTTLVEPPSILQQPDVCFLDMSCVEDRDSGNGCQSVVESLTLSASPTVVESGPDSETIVETAAETAVESNGFESLIELVMTAAESVRELMTPCLTAHGLNDARFTIMRAIRGSTNAECSQSELARCLKQSEANVSTLLDRMRGDGLVSREKSPFDRRRSVVRLTEKGEQQLKLTEQDYQSRSRGVLRAFDAFEIQAFREQLSNFIAIWETELDHSGSSSAVAGRIGENVSDSHTETSTETRHAQAG